MSDFARGYAKAIADVIAHLRDVQRGADAIGNSDVRWPSAAANRIEVVFARSSAPEKENEDV